MFNETEKQRLAERARSLSAGEATDWEALGAGVAGLALEIYATTGRGVAMPELEVLNKAGAALVRMGWKYVEGIGEWTPPPPWRKAPEVIQDARVAALVEENALVRRMNDEQASIVKAAQHEVAEMHATLRVVAPELIARLTSSCVWCGKEATQGLQPAELQEHVRAHVLVCDEHPLRAAEKRLDEARSSLLELATERNAARAEVERLAAREQDLELAFKKRTQEMDELNQYLDTLRDNAAAREKELMSQVEILNGRIAHMVPPDQHAKALVRARNEGLEQAAQHCEDAATHCACNARHPSYCTCHWSQRLDKAGDAIRAMKEPESNYPCSPTCTHEDAAKPGHPERVKERSEAVNAAVECPPSCPSHLNSGHTHQADDPSDKMHGDHADGYDAGAEAMRAACWEAVQEMFHRHGIYEKTMLYDEAKAAIEGATPGGGTR
jgi:hypothetical protein